MEKRRMANKNTYVAHVVAKAANIPHHVPILKNAAKRFCEPIKSVVLSDLWCISQADGHPCWRTGQWLACSLDGPAPSTKPIPQASMPSQHSQTRPGRRITSPLATLRHA